MRNALSLVAWLLLLASPVLASGPDLLGYDQFLSARGLAHGDVECVNPNTEDVLVISLQKWDSNRSVCEVWVKERVTPRQRLTFKDGNPVFMAVHEWEDRVSVPKTETRSGEFVVREESKQVIEKSKKSFKRYVTKGSGQ